MKAHVLLPPGEGGPKGRMRANLGKALNPHPPLRGTLSQWERDSPKLVSLLQDRLKTVLSWRAHVAHNLDTCGHRPRYRCPCPLFRKTAPNGGMIRLTECRRPCAGISAPSAPPRFPKSAPPYVFESLFSISVQ